MWQLLNLNMNFPFIDVDPNENAIAAFDINQLIVIYFETNEK